MNCQPLIIYGTQIQVSQATAAEGDDKALLVCLGISECPDDSSWGCSSNYKYRLAIHSYGGFIPACSRELTMVIPIHNPTMYRLVGQEHPASISSLFTCTEFLLDSMACFLIPSIAISDMNPVTSV